MHSQKQGDQDRGSALSLDIIASHAVSHSNMGRQVSCVHGSQKALSGGKFKK